MKRSCETCLWWDWDGDTHTDQRRGNCRHSDPPTHFLPAVWLLTIATDWCAKWEPRDRSLVRCETCEWWDGENAVGMVGKPVERDNGRVCMREFSAGAVSPPTATEFPMVTLPNWRCSHWRLREGRGDG